MSSDSLSKVKICGITERSAVAACDQAHVSYLGFVFFSKSPRHLSHDQAAALASDVPSGLSRVALTVNADNDALDALVAKVPLDLLQLHGGESPARVAEVKARYGLPVMKAVGIAGARDLAGLQAYETVADMILVDAKPPEDADLPGGNGLAFDWRLIAGRDWSVPWMLAGGLTPENVAEAIRLTGAPRVDVSSGVEAAPGRKDPDLIARFAGAARDATFPAG